MKVQVTIDDRLLDRADAYADENYLTRSGLVTLALSTFLNHYEMTKCVREMGLMFRKIAETGNLDDETLKQLADFERVCKVLVGK